MSHSALELKDFDPHPCIFLRHSGNSYRAGATHDVIARDFVWAAKAAVMAGLASFGGICSNVGYVDGGGGNALVMDVAGLFSLSFLGFGVSPPTPDWGLMISDARGFGHLPPGVLLGL